MNFASLLVFRFQFSRSQSPSTSTSNSHEITSERERTLIVNQRGEEETNHGDENPKLTSLSSLFSFVSFHRLISTMSPSKFKEITSPILDEWLKTWRSS